MLLFYLLGADLFINFRLRVPRPAAKAREAAS